MPMQTQPFSDPPSLQQKAQDENDECAQTAASRFFYNSDLCTLLCQAMIAHSARSLTGKMCLADEAASSLLSFRGVTRQAFQSVMYELPSRSVLNLTARDELKEGVLVYLDEPIVSPEIQLRQPKWVDQFNSFISHSEADASALRALEIDDPLYRTGNKRGPKARIITHHRAVLHQHSGSLLNASLFIPAEHLGICSTLPLALDMFLTQPPQKSIRFGIRYEYLPGLREYFEVNNDQGIRFGDLVAHLERKPELMKQDINSGHGLYRYRRWLRDSETIVLVRVAWEYTRAVVKGDRYERNARFNTENCTSL